MCAACPLTSYCTPVMLTRMPRDTCGDFDLRVVPEHLREITRRELVHPLSIGHDPFIGETRAEGTKSILGRFGRRSSI